MRNFSTGVFAAVTVILTPAARMDTANPDVQLVEEEGLRSNQFVTDAALWIIFKIEAGQMAAELGGPGQQRFAEQLVARQREEALKLTEYARAAAVEADALNRLQTHHPLARADGVGTVGDRNFLRAREATRDAPGSQSRTGSAEAPGSVAWSATQTGQMVERRLEALREASAEEFDTAFRQHLLEAHEAELALYEAYAVQGGRRPLAAYAQERLPELRHEIEQVQAVPEN